jgi:hypothetical protein
MESSENEGVKTDIFKTALSRAGLEPASPGEKDRPSKLPFMLILTFKKERRERTEGPTLQVVCLPIHPG